MSSCLKSIAVSSMILLVDLGQIQKYDKISTCSHCRGSKWSAFSYPCKGEMTGPADASPETKGTCRRFTVSGKC